MSTAEHTECGTGDAESQLGKWLRQVTDRQVSRRASAPSPSGPAVELLRRAARCYAHDAWAGDACRLLAQLGDDRSAAPYFEQLGQWAQAGASYARSGQWRPAARCWQQAGEPAEAADCLVQGGEPIEGAWLFAHHASQFIRARNLLAQLPDDVEHDPLAVALVAARCDAGVKKVSQAAGCLRTVADRLLAQPSAPSRHRVLDWAFALADELRRPDLAATLHAMAFQTDVPDARQRWEEWADGELGETTGIPEEDEAAREASAPAVGKEQSDGPEREASPETAGLEHGGTHGE